ncbi:MAG TPA: GNAT family N-acetyltransferase [Nocardioides sp.]|uniref:GNAT family N-acetyltransferase n=1 Tax=Nocardioides sp. TaxID=35761 RepID=UPI002B526C76|nr:GNAT family N-acetyltransferase [Nocardioides sp.]HTW17062.1 GNAT family N-acetyltransferase [Nocardioides sp.]
MEITYSTGTYYGEAETLHRWFAVIDGEQVGELYVAIDTEIIMNIEVDAAHRGEGIARALYEAADAQLVELRHAPAAACTPEGLAFAEAMGGPVADDMDELATYHEMMED